MAFHSIFARSIEAQRTQLGLQVFHIDQQEHGGASATVGNNVVADAALD
jgi:hypothetical protein